jgi:alpha-mannosidase
VGVEFNYKLGEHSQMKQYVTLDAVSSRLEFNCSVEWHENRKFLKVEFPLAVHNDFATYSSQFGHIRRPTHRNTSVSHLISAEKNLRTNVLGSGTWPSSKYAAITGLICPSTALALLC